MLRTRKSPICSWNVMSTRVHAGRSCYRTITLPLSLLTKDVHAPVSKECCELSVDGRVDTKHWRYQCDDISATRPTFVFRVPVCISRRLSLRSLTSLSRGGSVLGGMRGWATWCQAKGVVNRVPPASAHRSPTLGLLYPSHYRPIDDPTSGTCRARHPSIATLTFTLGPLHSIDLGHACDLNYKLRWV